MKTPLIFATVLVTLIAVTGCAAKPEAFVATQEEAATLKPTVEVKGEASAFKAQLRKSSTIRISVPSSPTIEHDLAARLQAAGVPLALDAPVTITIAATYSFQRRMEVERRVDLGKAIEAAKLQGTVDSHEEVATHSVKGVDVSATGGVLTGSMTPTAALGGSLVHAIADMTGFTSRGNQILTGDSRGICLTNCADWKKYAQSTTLVATVTGLSTQSITTIASAKEDKLYPEPLLDADMDALVHQLVVARHWATATAPSN
jgi:hypothetical protein